MIQKSIIDQLPRADQDEIKDIVSDMQDEILDVTKDFIEGISDDFPEVDKRRIYELVVLSLLRAAAEHAVIYQSHFGSGEFNIGAYASDAINVLEEVRAAYKELKAEDAKAEAAKFEAEQRKAADKAWANKFAAVAEVDCAPKPDPVVTEADVISALKDELKRNGFEIVEGWPGFILGKMTLPVRGDADLAALLRGLGVHSFNPLASS